MQFRLLVCIARKLLSIWPPGLKKFLVGIWKKIEEERQEEMQADHESFEASKKFKRLKE